MKDVKLFGLLFMTIYVINSVQGNRSTLMLPS